LGFSIADSGKDEKKAMILNKTKDWDINDSQFSKLQVRISSILYKNIIKS
jgi:hypothetical protein